MKIKVYGRCLWLVLLLGFTIKVPANAGEPTEVIKSAWDRLVQVLKDPTLSPKDKQKERVARLKEIIDPAIDYAETAKRVLGPHWQRRTPEEQQEFVTIFHDFVERIYTGQINQYEGEKIVFGRESVDQDFAQVESKIVDAKGEGSSLVFRLHRTDGKWRVYDAVVEDISMISNYRSQFDRVISSSSYEGLVKKLKEKIG
jgi:phospholipid transport system substrate-binding protein